MLKGFLTYMMSVGNMVHWTNCIHQTISDIYELVSIIFITLPNIYGEFFPEFKKYYIKPVLPVKAMYEVALSGK
jgi:hypothetical protein